MRYIFNVNEVVEVVRGYYTGCKGIIMDVMVDENNNTIYGLEINNSNNVVYFLAREIQ